LLHIENTTLFSNMLQEFELKIGKTLSKTLLYLDSNILDPIFYKTTCFNGGGHLLNLGNLSRLLIGEFMDYEKLVYLDSDSIVQNDIIEKILQFDLKDDIYAACANRVHENNQKQIVIKMNSIINCNYDWKDVLGYKLDKEEYVYMGAPFITNCKKWGSVYERTIKLIHIHNSTTGGIFKLFTMSIQNIMFHNKTGNISQVLHVLQDLGSKRKDWSHSDLIDQDVLDWSGVYKPWYSNGLYRHVWLHHDIMQLSTNYGDVIVDKKKSETFNVENLA
jgi:lipopolysaccharide biosynthesis glycosyltransferase